jgi:adenosylcobyric acid synthase
VRALMVQGASSSAGKSLLTTALARVFHRRGIDVVPFKAQNMSNNARVVAGGEIGTAQYLQALAAGIEPDVRMNPILIKPEGDNQSQVVVLGKPDLELSRLPWRERPAGLWPVIERSLQSLRAEHELLLLEGAGSPAEINLQDSDLANMRTAKAADARVILVADIDRGGAFAHLYGTWALLPEYERALIAGFVLNKFRGDLALLPPAPQRLEDLTGVPTLGVLPWLEHGLPDEDGAATPQRGNGRASVAVVRYPTASNLDEFKQLEQVVDVRWLDEANAADGADLLILPGSKHVAADLGWLIRTGLAGAVRERVRRGRRVLAICGGMQMLGERVEDQAGVDGTADGLGLLPLRTTFAASKQTENTSTRFHPLPEPWAALSEKAFTGYETRHGQTETTGVVAEALPQGRGFVAGPVLAIYLHGLFEQPELVSALFGAPPARSLEQAFDELADAVEANLNIDVLLTEIGAA